MPSKRRRDTEQIFDPNESDPDDENFEPGDDRPSRPKKRSRSNKSAKSGRKRRGAYGGSDIDDDEDVSDSNEEVSFDDDDGDEDEDEDEEDAPVNAAGRRTRKAAAKPVKYEESDEEEEEDNFDDDDDDSDDAPTNKKNRKAGKSRHRGASNRLTAGCFSKPFEAPRRRTRSQTEEAEDLVELSNSGNHERPVSRSSKSKSPDTFNRIRSSRAAKGIKKPPETIEEATQESSVLPHDEDEDELAGSHEDVAVDAQRYAEMQDVDKDVAQDASVKGDVAADEDDDDDDDIPITNRRATRAARSGASAAASIEEPEAEVDENEKKARPRLTRGLSRKSKSAQEPSSDFEPGEESGEDAGMSDSSDKKAHRAATDVDSPTPRGRGKRRSARSSRRGQDSDDEEEVELDRDEIADELVDLVPEKRPRRRRTSPEIIYQETSKRRRAAAKPMNYFMPPVTALAVEEDEADEPARTPARNRRGGRGGASQNWDRLVNATYGPFGGGGGAATTRWATAPNTKALADADPLGVDLSVDFNQVGGLQGHIDQLKEMVQLPLLYPELFQKFHVTPPRGVLFHGPPGTGKTLLARALANSVSVGGKKITFYMRKGADALSKWVGEAEKQLRLLFEEARRTQPSIIFFDEIDGLAPVRSSKQEQIHASIVSTLLALMDGMDGRGQVIVIGATNRPDNIDPALRRPGRFDREFYFPLPDVEGRRSILNIHTKDWGLSEEFMQSLAENTKGYGGADLRALCTEAALNSIQRTYPQVYSSKEKLIVDPGKIQCHAADFMMSIKRMIPSSERSAGSGAAPLPKSIDPLLRDQFSSIKKSLDELLPRKKKMTALDEAMYEQFDDDDHGFGREALSQEFERSRIFRPRFLISGVSGMGQSYLSSALLHYFEGVHVQNFGLPNLLADGRPMEQVIVGLFTEVKRHKPSVIYIPNIDVWFMGISDVALVTFKAMLKSIPPTDPVLVLATAEHEEGEPTPPELLKDIFGFSRKNRLEIARPKQDNRREYFSTIIEHIRKSPTEFPDPTNRKKRVLEELPVAPPPPPKVLSREEIKAQQKKDHQMLNILKVLLQPIMDQINRKYKKFRQPVIPSHLLEHLFLETDPNYIRPDLAEGEVRPYEIVKDKDGTDILRETATGKTFYNLETTTIEERLSNGFYCRPQDFYRDIKTLAKDSRAIGDKERTLKANEIVTNVDVDVAGVIQQTAHIDWDALKHRQIERAKLAADKERKRRAMQSIVDRVQSDTAAGNDSDSQGPVVLGEPIPGSRHTTTRFQPISPLRTADAIGSDLHSHSNGNTKPSRLSDVQMGGVDDDTQPIYEPHVMKPPAPEWLRTDHITTTSSAMATAGNTQLSQRSVVTTVPPGVSPSALLNDASTTKTSDPSDRSSSKWSTQHTNGYHADHNARMDDSQLPDTQIPPGGGGSQLGDDQWQHSQLDALHRPSDGPATQSSQVNSTPSAAQKSQAISLGNILNDSPTNDHIRNSGSSSSQQQVVIHESRVEALHDELTSRTSGCTIEQLEQINRELMDEVWKTRGDWNRMTVLGCITRVFNDTIKDIEDIQGLLQQSQE
ncbi:ATPase family AAA domain-containing protein 2B [Verticillium alfalfae VaMs.102]|uniref:ATPase family AAA domain-containing protein 2B n=1 Tax=Verticillium alfalfae (strain VaMs.102 / ATCC MYA-4576 / FGSC 10136) TaxID=526221 RepID=C9SVF1_VERA1|nr:ATPase family AAA domain-containing protein 2B [Verticillium alfalfae VaMs.102]EEY22766.1 ATPase family AAA domain-containing protein 2B [Verticillium alfalfae VaMs.102]